MRQVAALALGLPSVRELDLTGNGLRALPPAHTMSRFGALVRLVLERNGLGDDADGGSDASGAGSSALAVCSACPALEDLQVRHTRPFDRTKKNLL